MNIIVCIKQVPNTTQIKMDPVTGVMDRNGIPSIMNPDDKVAVEYALELKELFDAHVTVISMGPMQAKKILFEAIAMGADKGILLSDRAFAGADTLATSKAFEPYLPNHKLDTVSEALNINLWHHHNALSDSEACAGILIEENKRVGDDPIKKMVKPI